MCCCAVSQPAYGSGQPKRLEHLSADTQASRSRLRSNSTEARDAFCPLCDVFQMLFVGTEKHQGHVFGIPSSKRRHPGTLANARCEPQNMGLPPADLLRRKLLGLREFVLCCTSRASCGQTDGTDAAGVLPPLPGAERSQEADTRLSSVLGWLAALPWTRCLGGQSPTLPRTSQPGRQPGGGIHSRQPPLILHTSSSCLVVL